MRLAQRIHFIELFDCIEFEFVVLTILLKYTNVLLSICALLAVSLTFAYVLCFTCSIASRFLNANGFLNGTHLSAPGALPITPRIIYFQLLAGFVKHIKRQFRTIIISQIRNTKLRTYGGHTTIPNIAPRGSNRANFGEQFLRIPTPPFAKFARVLRAVARWRQRPFRSPFQLQGCPCASLTVQGLNSRHLLHATWMVIMCGNRIDNLSRITYNWRWCAQMGRVTQDY